MSNLSHRRFATLMLVLFVLLALLTAVLMASAASASTDGPTVDRDTAHAPAWAWAKDWTPCANDEVQPTRCVWDARHNGNGSGHSYIQTRRGVIIFVKHAHAHRLLLPAYAP